MLQLFGRFKGTGDEHYALEKKRQEDTSEELKRINDEKIRLSKESANPNLGEEERVTLQDKFIKLSKKEVDEILRCGKAAEAAVEKYFSIFNYSNSVFNSFEDIERIASKMAGDDRFEPICKAVREMEQDNEKGLNEAVWDTVIKTMKLLFTDKDIEDVKKDYARDYETLNDGHLSEQFITVKKEIPVDKRTGKALYTDSPLWVHMYQKVYTASNIRTRKVDSTLKIGTLVSQYKEQLKKDNPDMDENELKRLTDEKKKEYEKYYENSYEKIEGGSISGALGMIHGTYVKSTIQQPIIFSNAEKEVEALKEDPDAITRIRGSLPQLSEQEIEMKKFLKKGIKG